ncbi:SLAP domain-containing protein [Lactobacillus intestinalis]|uniref:SLAP domain-containing protein n=1 Tax=Lactobacillus intestinalis TaxID=151781 RepID=UPI001F59568C|nr:SLAP domain-containing protein [Lactobacillus intestinalis]
MKKNLRIVSAAAAALLAVAPIAASTVTVNADVPSTQVPGNTNSQQISLDGNVQIPNNDTVVDVTPSLTMTAANGNIPGSLTGSISATLAGKSFTANLRSQDQNNVKVYVRQSNGHNGTQVTNWKSISNKMYNVVINNVGFNFGSENAGKTITFESSNKNVILESNGDNPNLTVSGNKVTAKLDQNGTTYGLKVTVPVTAFDTANTNNVLFYDIANGTQVTTGNAMVLANAQGKLNVNSLLPAVNSNYTAVQLVNGQNENGNGNWSTASAINRLNIEAASNIKDQLTAEGVKVDANGFFDAPRSFKLNVKATSKINGKSAELPVTFTVANSQEKPAQENGVDKTIMHNAYYYDKDGQRVGKGKITRYETVSVVEKTVSINGKTYYKLANTTIDGKDVYVNADNISGTPRTLKHNAYVYATSKKRANKQVLKKGDTVTTYGDAYTFKNGKKYYKIGDDKAKTYVKASNF